MPYWSPRAAVAAQTEENEKIETATTAAAQTSDGLYSKSDNVLLAASKEKANANVIEVSIVVSVESSSQLVVMIAGI